VRVTRDGNFDLRKNMQDRGNIIEIGIGQTIEFNEETYKKARIEIDHINFGINKKTKKLNPSRRSRFSPEDICEFLILIDGMELAPVDEDSRFSYFVVELDCPVKGSFFGRTFRMVFTVLKSEKEVIGIITLFRI
jgi:hypothetical protein